jgi:hypothetical protein
MEAAKKLARLIPFASSMYKSLRTSIMNDRTRASAFQYLRGRMLPLKGRLMSAENCISSHARLTSASSRNGEWNRSNPMQTSGIGG